MTENARPVVIADSQTTHEPIPAGDKGLLPPTAGGHTEGSRHPRRLERRAPLVGR